MASRRGGRYDEGMGARGNLADPAYEPSDADLARLMHDAFEHIRDAREESLLTMRARIERLQAEARARFEATPRTSDFPLAAKVIGSGGSSMPFLVSPDTYDVPPATPTGTYKLCAEVDPGDAISETSETDNDLKSERDFTVTP
jgi:hypothetical protein